MIPADMPYVSYADLDNSPAMLESVVGGHVIELAENVGIAANVMPADCLDVDSAFGVSANNLYSPLGVVFNNLGYRWNNKKAKFDIPEKIADSIKVGVLEQPKNGRLVDVGYKYGWVYVANRDYVGRDKVVYSVEVGGVSYRVVLNLLVHEVVPEPNEPPACRVEFERPPHKSGKVGSLSLVDNYSVGFASLEGAVAEPRTHGVRTNIFNIPQYHPAQIRS